MYEMKKTERGIGIVLFLSENYTEDIGEPLMSKGNKHDYKIFSKSLPASLLHCIENILSHSSGKFRDSLTMAALSFTFVQYLFTNISSATA